MSEDSNIHGRGASIMLPPDGNPFRHEQPADAQAPKAPAGAARWGRGPMAAPGSDAPADLSPEDVAALFPASPEARNLIPQPGSPPSSDESTPLLTLDELDSLPAQPPSAGQPPVSAAAPRDAVALGTFDPDAPIVGRPTPMSRSAAPLPVESFDPDAPAGADFAGLAEAASIKADAPPAEYAPPVAMSLGGAGAPAADTAAEINIEGGVVKVDSVAVAASAAADSSRPAPRVASGASDIVPEDVSSPGADPLKDLPVVPAASVLLPLKEKDSLLQALVTPQRVEALWQRIEAVERRAIEEDSSLPAQRTANLENLRAARNILLGGEEYYEDASRYVAEVEADLLYTRRVRRWSYTYGVAVLLYNIVWFIGLFYSYNLTQVVATRFAGAVDPQYSMAVWITLLAGGLGGVSKSMFSLYTHVAKQDFDRQFLMWYIASPIAGVVLGLFVYVFAQMGLTGVIAAAQMGSPELTGDTQATIVSTGGFILYGLAWVVGFQQNLVLRMVDRVIKLIFGSSEEKKELEEATKSKSPTKSG